MAANKSSKSNRPSNYVIFTLRAIRDGESRYSKSGFPFATVRAFLSQGKDKQTGEYKPSVFFDVKAFSQDENATPAVEAISNIADKDYFTVKGRLSMDEWTGDDGVKRQQLVVFAQSVEPFRFDNEAEQEEDEGEPA